jgi:hypothetical protein
MRSDVASSGMMPRGVGRHLRRVWDEAKCLIRHYDMWKFDGQSANGKRWLCRICGKRWAFCWR